MESEPSRVRGFYGVAASAHRPVTNHQATNLRLRVARRVEPAVVKLTEWILAIAETRHQAWLRGDSDPLGLPLPDQIGQTS